MPRAAEGRGRSQAGATCRTASGGADPAELIARDGAEALRARVEASVPFPVFHVERTWGQADVRSAEGRDRALAELVPVLGALPASVLREDLLRRVAGRLELSEASVASLVATPAPTAARVRACRDVSVTAVAGDQGFRAERTFLAMCIALPDAGRGALDAIDPDELLMSGEMRRAARHVASRTESPLSDLPVGDGSGLDRGRPRRTRRSNAGRLASHGWSTRAGRSSEHD